MGKTYQPQIVKSYDKSWVNFDFVVSLNQLIIVSHYLTIKQLDFFHQSSESWLLSMANEDAHLFLNFNLIPDRSETFLEKIVSLQAAAVNIYFLILTNLTNKLLFIYLLQEHLRHNHLFNQKLIQREGLSPYSQYQFAPMETKEEQFLPFSNLNIKLSQADLKLELSVLLATAAELYLQNFYQQIGFFVPDRHQLEIQNKCQYLDLYHLALIQNLLSLKQLKLSVLAVAKLTELFLLNQALKHSEGEFSTFFKQAIKVKQNQVNVVMQMLKQTDLNGYKEVVQLVPVVTEEKMLKEKLKQFLKIKVDKSSLFKAA